MARRNTRSTSRRTTARRRSTTRRKKRFQLRWYHLVASSVAAFALGYLLAFGQATTYVAKVAGLR